VDEDKEKRQIEVTRRYFFQVAGVSACTLVLGGTAALGFDFINPRVLFEPSTKFSLMPPGSMEPGQIQTVEAHRVYVMRLTDGFRALSSVCTHLGCVTRFQPDSRTIACPCHGSRFDLNGDVLGGPAPRALRWLEMDVSQKGLITVDTAMEVPSGTVYKL
jgi:cytochrome b6-f complex iron-sulfur subunit